MSDEQVSAGHATATEIAPSREDAGAAVKRMLEISAEARGCAVLGPGGEPLAASGDAERWGAAAAGFLAAADSAGERPATHVHVATEEGEVFAVRERGLAMVAVSERYALASLMLFDMRTVLRELATGRG
jgi:hypothetical protein